MASTSSTQTTAASETTSSTCHEDQFSMQDVKKFCVRQIEYLVSPANLRNDTFLRNTLRKHEGKLPINIARELPSIQPCLDAFKGDLEEFKDTILIQAVQEHSTVLSIQGDASHTYVVCHSVDENELVEEEGGLAHWGDPYSTVFVGGLSPKVTQRTLHELMSFAGPVVAIRAPHLQQSSLQENNTGNWQRKLYAFVEFANRSGVRYACRVMNGIRLYDILITVRPSKLPKPESSDTELFVGNLASNCDEGILEEIFSICGKIVEINVARYPNGASKGYSFISYETLEEAETAIASLNCVYILGSMIQVDFSRKTKRDISQTQTNIPDTNSSLLNSSSSQSSVNLLRRNLGIADIVDRRYRFEVASTIAAEHAWRVGAPHPPISSRYDTAVQILYAIYGYNPAGSQTGCISTASTPGSEEEKSKRRRM